MGVNSKISRGVQGGSRLGNSSSSGAGGLPMRARKEVNAAK